MTDINDYWINRRRIRNGMIALIAICLIALFVVAQRNSLQNASFTTGYILLGALFFLASFNLKKKLPFLAFLGRSTTWMQAHIYVGFASVAVFVIHIGFSIPNGMFETILAVLFAIVATSGIYGLFITRLIPKRLSALNEEIVYERIPALRNQLAQTANSLAVGLAAKNPMFAEFYVERVAPFLHRGRGFSYSIRPTGTMRRNLVSELNDMNRYLSKDERQIGTELRGIVQRKDDLDYHRVMQGRLKLWLFFHVGFTYSLLLVAMIHGVMVHAFAGN